LFIKVLCLGTVIVALPAIFGYGIDCFVVTDLSKIRNGLNSVKQVLRDRELVLFLNHSTVSGFLLLSSGSNNNNVGS
jgi:hypothetical protein